MLTYRPHARRRPRTVGIRCATAILGLVAALWATVATAQTWVPGNNNPPHYGCTAGDIVGTGIVGVQDPSWKGHTYQFSVDDLADMDCFGVPMGGWNDVAEAIFTCVWEAYWYDPDEEEWTLAKTGGSDPMMWGWWTGTIFGEPSGKYFVRAKDVDDTPGDGPGGDDTKIGAVSSVEFDIKWPYPINWSHSVLEDNPDEGDLRCTVSWSSSCGHVSHLCGTEMREYVTYDLEGDPCTVPDPPWENSQHDNPAILPNPPYGGDDVIGPDDHTPGNLYWAEDITGGGEVSAHQLFQWRYRYAYGDHEWKNFFETPYDIDREVVQDGGDWVYTITHEGASAGFVIPSRP